MHIRKTLLTLPLLLLACDDPADAVPASQSVTTVAPTPAAPAAASPTSGLSFSSPTSTVTFVGSKVTGSHEGGFQSISGTVRLGAESLAPAERIVQGQVDVRMQTASLNADDPDLTEHLKSGDFFDVARFPEARFVSSRITAGGEGGTHTIVGTLTLHGQSKEISFPATVTLENGGVAAHAEFSINRNDFGMTFPGQADNLIRDRVVIRFNIHAQHD